MNPTGGRHTSYHVAPFGGDGDNVNYVLIHAPFRADEEQYTKFLRAPSRGYAKEKKCKKKINS